MTDQQPQQPVQGQAPPQPMQQPVQPQQPQPQQPQQPMQQPMQQPVQPQQPQQPMQQPAPAQLPAVQQASQAAVPAVDAGRQLVAPEYVQGMETGLETAVQYIVPPRLKVIQKMTSGPLAEQFNTGDVVVTPQNILVAPMQYENNRALESGQGFTFVPLFWFAEWCTWNPRGSKITIAERSLDDTSEIAAKSRDPKRRMETVGMGEDGQPLKVRHCEHLCFILKLDQGPLAGIPIVQSFVRGEHRTGSNFLGLARMRKAPLFTMRFEASSGIRRNDDGDWYGLNIGNPTSEPAWVTEQEVKTNQRIYEEMKAAHAANLLRADYEDDAFVIDTGSVSSSPAEF